MEGVGIFATIEQSMWAQNMIRSNRYVGNCWINKALGILERGEIDFGGITPTSPEIRDRLADLIGWPKNRHQMGKVVYFGQKKGLLAKTGTERKSHEGRAAYPEYHVIDQTTVAGTI